MTQKHLKPRKKSGLGKTQNVASEAVRIMALSQRGRISKPQQKKRKEKKNQKKKDVIPLFCFPDSKTPEITHNRKQTSGKTKKHGEQQTAMRLSAIMPSEVCIIDKQERQFRRSDHTPSSDRETSKLNNLVSFILDSIGTCAQTNQKRGKKKEKKFKNRKGIKDEHAI
jgi:hypothetical protein